MTSIFANAALVAALLVAAGTSAVPSAQAQTATDLKCNGCVGKKDIGKNALTSKKIADGAVRAEQMAAGARPDAARNAFLEVSFGLSDTGATHRKIEVDLPVRSNLIAFANWQFAIGNEEGGDCAITLDTFGFLNTFSNGASENGNINNQVTRFAMSATGMFHDVPAGEHTVRLFCRADPGDHLGILNPSLTVMAVPQGLD